MLYEMISQCMTQACVLSPSDIRVILEIIDLYRTLGAEILLV